MGLGVHNAGLFQSPRRTLAGLGDDTTSVDLPFPFDPTGVTPLPDSLPITTPPIVTIPNLPNITGAASGAAAGMTPAQIAAVFNSAANTAVNVYRATQAPNVVPGSSVVYDPSTGRFLNAQSGALISSPLGSASLSGSSGLLMILVGGAILLLLAGKH